MINLLYSGDLQTVFIETLKALLIISVMEIIINDVKIFYQN
jgi:hypothetical protein